MSHRPTLNPCLVVALSALQVAVSFCAGQDGRRAGEGPDDSRDGVIEVYLTGRGLDALLAVHLEGVLERSAGTRRVAVAERLGAAYARLLADSADRAEREDVAARAGELLEAVPGADTFDLRIALIKARYLRAEEEAERARLELASPDERASASAFMDSVAGELEVLVSKSNRRVLAFENRERTGSISDYPAFRASLAEARRQRSLANYYAGWANYYNAMLSGKTHSARDAIRQFGVLLGGEGRDPTIESMPVSLLRYEHVARAAVGVALCHGLLGDHAEAVDWLSAVEEAEDANPGVLDQLFNRRVTVLTGARRWDTLARAVERRRGAPLAEPAPDPLAVAESRLLAVELLGALRAPDADRPRRDAAEPILRCAMSDLIALGQTAQVLDLAERHGTLPLGETGFIPKYVRGLRAYRAARELHGEGGADSNTPTREPPVVAAYLEAEGLLAPAFDDPDASSFPTERANAGVMLGMSLYYKDSPAEAADRFELAARGAPDGAAREEAFWMTVVSLERAVGAGRPDLQKRLDAAVALYVRAHPGTDRAARLLLRFADTGMFDRELVLEALLGLGRSSPLYDSAREHAADTLYGAYARSVEPERSALAARFVSVALERIERGLQALRGGDGGVVSDLALRARQALDAALTPLVSDPGSARRALAALDEIGVRSPGALVGLGLEPELLFRALQLAVADGDDAALETAHRDLTEIGGTYLEAANRFLFERAYAAWESSGDASDARRVVEIGGHLLADPEVPRTRLAIADAVARAATAIWEEQRDRLMLDAALDLDRLVLASHTPTSSLLRRLARNAEDAGETLLAQQTWNRLSASLPPDDMLWYEARYNALRLLADEDPEAALEAIRQHRVLYPQMGPDPWGTRLRALLGSLEPGGTP